MVWVGFERHRARYMGVGPITETRGKLMTPKSVLGGMDEAAALPSNLFESQPAREGRTDCRPNQRFTI